MTVLSTRRALGAFGSDFSDPTNERLIYLSAAGLVLVGVALLVGTIMWWRRGRQEHPSLAPLEVLGTRAWGKASEGDRRRKLDQVRIGGSAVVEDEFVRPEPVDLRELVRSMPQAFDDLREPSPDAEEPAEIAIDAPLEEPAEVVIDAPIEPVEAAAAEAAEPAAPAATVAPAPAAPAVPVAMPVVVDPDATTFSAPRSVDESAAVPGGNS